MGVWNGEGGREEGGMEGDTCKGWGWLGGHAGSIAQPAAPPAVPLAPPVFFSTGYKYLEQSRRGPRSVDPAIVL